MKFASKLFLVFVGFSAFLSLAFVGTFYLFVFKKAELDLKSQAQLHAYSLAVTLSKLIDGDKHQTILTRADENSEAYKEIQRVLRTFRDANREVGMPVQYVYTKIRTEHKDTLAYVVDAQEDDRSIASIDPTTKDTTFNFTPVGQRVEVTWQRKFQKASVSDFYSDPWGMWITGAGPIRNSAGTVVAFAYVDVSGTKVLEELNAIKQRITVVSVIALIALLTLSAILSYVLANFVNRPLNNLREGLTRIKDGVFDFRIPINRKDDFQDLAEAFNVMSENMRTMAAQISNGSRKIASTSTEILAISREQATTSSQQSISVTETTATMEELTSTSRYIAENSESVVKIAAETHEISQEAVDLSGVAKDKMEEIRRKSDQDTSAIADLNKKMQKITEVIEIINTVTEQTKLISFNARLEATGAGEAGRRFSVVASEIRRLAENVAESTEEIKETVHEIRVAMDSLVKNSKESAYKIREGVDLVSKVSTVLENILLAAQNTTESAKQISLSTQQQRTASEQVVTTLKEISEGAKHFVKSSNQAAIISGDLNALSDELNKTLNNFKVGR
ncbi:MAG TPA: methyl-accepting chemotaxis protein [bacterium]|nr:methyl-accepting chemotaxis protein [bacterium]